MSFHRLPTAAVLAALASLAAAPRSSWAQTTTPTPTMTTLTKEDFWIRVRNGKANTNAPFLLDADIKYFFNRARCECDTPISIRVELSQIGTQKRNLVMGSDGAAILKIGPSGCVSGALNSVTNEYAQGRCVTLDSRKLDQVSNAYEVNTTVGALFHANGEVAGGGCEAVLPAQTIWLAIDASLDHVPDLVDASAPQLPLSLDGLAPEPPANVKVSGGNEALNVSWTKNAAKADQNGYLVFCARGGTLAPFASPPYYSGRQYQTPSHLCPTGGGAGGAGGSGAVDAGTAGADGSAHMFPHAVDDAGAGGSDGAAGGSGGTGGASGSGGTGGAAGAGGTAGSNGTAGSSGEAGAGGTTAARNEQADGRLVAPPDAFVIPDPAFLCSELLTSGDEWRIKGLQNGVPYVVGVASVDTHGNASPIQSAVLQIPVATKDFYRGYRDVGGEAEGGFCAYGSRSRSLGLFGIGMVAAAGALVLRAGRRRRR